MLYQCFDAVGQTSGKAPGHELRVIYCSEQYYGVLILRQEKNSQKLRLLFRPS